MSKFKEEQILIIAPGSQTTLAQLGVHEQITPARLRVPTRMFAAEVRGQYEPYRVRQKIAKVKRTVPVQGIEGQTTSTNAVDQTVNGTADTNGTADAAPTTEEVEEEETVWEEDMEDDEGAIYPIEMGRIVNMPALLALLTHIDIQISPNIHTPVTVVCDPNWTPADREQIAQFYFQTYSRPAVTMIDSALAISSAYGVVDALVIDMGKDKTSISAVTDFFVNEIGRQPCIEGIGGIAVNAALMAEREIALEEGKIKGPKFTYEMAEQLKRQPHICECLPFGTPLPSGANGSTGNPASAASTGAESGDKFAAPTATVPTSLPRGPGVGTQTGMDEIAGQDGVLDVAQIVASGKTNEFIAKREQEQAVKVQKGGNKKGAAQEPPKPARIPNAQKPVVMFRYQEKVQSGDSAADGVLVLTTKEIEVGKERFGCCNQDDMLWPLANAVLTVLAATPVDKRNDLASSIIIVGNGSKVKGLKDRIVAYLDLAVKVSMNNTSIFTSELPSSFSTPLATGANTPLPQGSSLNQQGGTPTPGPGPGVNPLLLAATTASQHNLAPPGSQPLQSSLQPGTTTPGGPGQQILNFQSHQTQQGPTALRLTPPKDYFSEWKDHGMEEAGFLGAQVLSKTIFTMDNGPSLSYMTRQNFNEEGPMGIHAYFLGH